MPGCAVKYCDTVNAKDTNRSFFTFPAEGKSPHEHWTRYVQIRRRDDHWFPTPNSKLCSLHFKKEDMYSGKTGRCILKRGSVPRPPTIEDYIPDAENRPTSPASVDISDSDSIFDSPQTMKLKAKVNRLQQQKVQHQTKIKKLWKKNRSLKRELYSMRELVIQLNKNNMIQKKTAQTI